MLSYKRFLEPNCGFQQILAASPYQSGGSAWKSYIEKDKYKYKDKDKDKG